MNTLHNLCSYREWTSFLRHQVNFLHSHVRMTISHYINFVVISILFCTTLQCNNFECHPLMAGSDWVLFWYIVINMWPSKYQAARQGPTYDHQTIRHTHAQKEPPNCLRCLSDRQNGWQKVRSNLCTMYNQARFPAFHCVTCYIKWGSILTQIGNKNKRIHTTHRVTDIEVAQGHLYWHWHVPWLHT